MLQKKFMTVIGMLVLVSMILAACAPPAPVIQTVVVTEVVEGKTVEKVVTATPVPPTALPPTAAPQAADTIVIAMTQEPDTLHAYIGSMAARTIVLNPLRVGCMSQNEKTEWIPLGCESVPTLENGGAKLVGEGMDKHLELTYKIRKDWRWTDGTPVTSKDVVYWWKLIMDPNFEIASRTFYEKIYQISAVDDNTVLVKFLSNQQIIDASEGKLTGDINFAAFKEDYASTFGTSWKGFAVDPVYWNAIDWLPEHVLANVSAKDQPASDYAKKPLGDGAYEIKEWKQGQEIDMVASSKPFPLGEPKIKNIIFRFYGDTGAVIAALQNGEVDIVSGNVGGLTEANGPDLDKVEAGGLYKVMYVPQYAWEHIDLNVTKFPLDDVKVRQALYYAIDKKAIVDTIYYGKKMPTDLPIPKGVSWAYTEDYTKYPFDVEKAKALLAEAGWDCKSMPCTKDGKNLEFTLMTTDRADRQAIAQVIQSMWKKINVGVNLQFLYGRGLFAAASAGGPLYSRTFDAAIYTWISGDDPGFMGLYDCASIPTKENNYSGQNNPGWCNKDATEALNQSENNPDVALYREKRMPYITQFFKLWTAEVPVIPLFNSAEPYPYRTGLKNFKPGPTQYSYFTWNVWEWELAK